MSMKLPSPLIALAALAAVGSGAAVAATSQHGRYVTSSVTEPASSGLPASKPLDRFVAVSSARVVVPAEWTHSSAKQGQLRFLTPGSSCRYNVTFTIRSRAGADRSPADYVAAGLPSPGARYVLDEGQRRASAFRVIREKGTGAVVRVRGLWAAVVTRRADVAPSGQVVWTELSVSAVSRKGDECHAGTWRERMGPQIADALATARTRLKFVAKPA
jgi:hypothetical protein